MAPLHRQIVGPLNFYLPSEMMYENEKFSSSPLLKVYSQIKMVLLVDINKPFFLKHGYLQVFKAKNDLTKKVYAIAQL